MNGTINACFSGFTGNSVMKIKALKNIWLLILILEFIGGWLERAQSAQPNVPFGERTISFPTDFSMGELSVRDWSSTKTGGWTILGEARGKVVVPAGKELRLKVPPDHSGDLSPLSEMGPSDLQSLVLNNTPIADAGLVHLKGLTSLETLHLENTQVGDEGLAYLKPLTSLKTLFLAGTQITDAGLVHIGELTSLHKLCVGRTQISDTGLEHLKNLTFLHDLCVGSTQVTDSGLEHLKGLTALKRLNLRGTKVSHAGLTELKQALTNCNISGPFVPEARQTPKSQLARYLEQLQDAGIPLYLPILILVIAVPIVCLIISVFLRMSTKWVVKFKIPYWAAYKITIIAWVVGLVFGIPFNILGTLWAELLELVVYFLVHSAIYGTMIKHPEINEKIGFGKGMLITLYMTLIWIVLACVIGFSIRILILLIPYI
jgi:hypothetical protein